MKKNLKISVIIPTMNRVISLDKTLEKISFSTYIPDQILIIDQTEENEDRDYIKHILQEKYHDMNIDYIYQSKASSTIARNTGIKKSENELLVFMDDDVDVESDTFNNIKKIFFDENISMVAGIDKLESESKSKIGYFFCSKSFRKRKIGYVTKSMLGRFPDNIKKIDKNIETQWAMGFFFVVRKSLINKWNINFDEKLIGYAYAEDLDFTYSYYKKSKEENLNCVISPTIKVNHNCSKEWRIPSRKSTFMYIINREYLRIKHFNCNSSKIQTSWNNFGMLIMRILKRENSRDMIEAMYCCKKNKEKIKQGNVNFELYD